jgi:hypothetical protein
MGFQRVERGLERLVEGVFARAFKSGLQPVEIGRRLAREMDLRRKVGTQGVLAPNHFKVSISQADAESFDSFNEALVRQLVDSLREHGRVERYSFLGPLAVEVTVDDNISPGLFEVTGTVEALPGGMPMGALTLPDGRRIDLTNQSVAIGRLPSCEIPLADPNVSRQHAEVRRAGSHFVVVDLGSTNGTSVNGAKLTGERRLYDGDVIEVGSTGINFEGA